MSVSSSFVRNRTHGWTERARAISTMQFHAGTRYPLSIWQRECEEICIRAAMSGLDRPRSSRSNCIMAPSGQSMWPSLPASSDPGWRPDDRASRPGFGGQSPRRSFSSEAAASKARAFSCARLPNIRDSSAFRPSRQSETSVTALYAAQAVPRRSLRSNLA